MLKNGIDVSKHQGKIDWQKVKAAGVEFAIIRAGYGKEISQKDEQLESNYSGCKAAGMPVGAYWYSYAMSADEAKKEAETCLSVIKNKQFEYPIYFDIEESKQLALGKSKCTEIAKAFCEAVENAGYFVGIYSSKSHLETYLTEEIRARYAVWVAHYGVTKTTYSGQYGIWQKSSSGKINGINGNVDIDECYIDYPTTIKKNNLNGYKTVTASSTKSNGTTTSSSTKSSTPSYKQGQAVKLTKTTPLFANESATTAAGNLKAGTYYIYDGKICNLGRYRITTSAANCGKTPAGKYVTGYVSYDNFE